jgi:diguanylate cyclase (GGDEF)-like protein/PAS domain S-box-containing protein
MILLLFGLGALLVLLAFGPPWPAGVKQWLSDTLLPVYSLGAAIVLLLGGRRTRQESPRAGLAWIFISISVFASFVAELLWSVLAIIGAEPFPSIADVFYLAYYPIFLAGILLLPFERSSRREQWTKFLEIAIITLSAALILWSFIIGPLVQDSDMTDRLGLVFTVLYPLCDLLILLALLALSFRDSNIVRVRPLVFLAGSAGLTIAADMIFSVQELGAGYRAGGLGDAFYTFGYICLGAAGVCQWVEPVGRQARTRARPDKLQARSTNWLRTYLPPFMLLAAYYLLIQSYYGNIPIRFNWMVIWMGILLALTLAIQFLYADQVFQLYQKTLRNNLDLEAMVQERTKTLVGMGDALRLSEERYRSVVEASPALVCSLEADGRITFANEVLASYFNATTTGLSGKSLYEFMPAESAALVRERLESLSDSQPIFSLEYPTRVRGEERWLRWVIRAVFTDGLAKYHAVGEDITAQKLAAQQLEQSEQKYRSLFETMAQGVVYQDAEGKIISANPAAERILGLTLDQMQGRTSVDPYWRAIHPDGTDFPGETHPAMVALHTGRAVKDVVMGVYNPQSDSYRWININASPQFLPGEDRPYQVYATFEDITPQKLSELAIQKANQQLQKGVEQLSLLAQLDELLQMCQNEQEAYAAIGTLIARIFPEESGVIAVAENDDSIRVVMRWGATGHAESLTPDGCFALRRGRPYLVEDTSAGLICSYMNPEAPSTSLCIPMIAQNEVYGSLHLLAPLGGNGSGGLDESSRKLGMMVANSIALALSNIRLREKLRAQAVRDPLTGLYNRRFMEESLNRELERARRKGTPLGVMMLDIDHFKAYNDRYGHEAGDRLLTAVANLMRARIRTSDIACRYGGEEFIIVLPETNSKAALERAELLTQQISQLRIEFEEQLLDPVSVSVGVASYPGDGQDVQTLLRLADKALYRAKDLGRNRVMEYAKMAD